VQILRILSTEDHLHDEPLGPKIICQSGNVFTRVLENQNSRFSIFSFPFVDGPFTGAEQQARLAIPQSTSCWSSSRGDHGVLSS